MHGASFLSPCHVQLGVMSRRRRHFSSPCSIPLAWGGTGCLEGGRGARQDEAGKNDIQTDGVLIAALWEEHPPGRGDLDLKERAGGRC